MNAFITAGVVAAGLLVVAIWVEMRERGVTVINRNYRSSGKSS
jgi:hypothetical protein